jgi:hypothetical protein
VSPVKYELGLYIPEDDILHSHSRENLKSYLRFTFYLIFYTVVKDEDVFGYHKDVLTE